MEFGALDRAVYQAVATTPTARPRPSAAAPVSFRGRWRSLAGDRRRLVATRRAPGRRVASEAVTSLAVTAITVNLGAKSIFQRRRPDRTGHDRTPERRVPTPSSSSFPSGHSATSFAFAYTVGRHLPFVGIPIRLLAAAVAYSRVHIGVHYPGDVIVGSIMGAGTAAAVGSAWDRRRP